MTKPEHGRYECPSLSQRTTTCWGCRRLLPFCRPYRGAHMAEQGSRAFLAHETERRAPVQTQRDRHLPHVDHKHHTLHNGSITSGRYRSLPEGWKYDGIPVSFVLIPALPPTLHSSTEVCVGVHAGLIRSCQEKPARRRLGCRFPQSPDNRREQRRALPDTATSR